jgi:two-component system LytT family sensor kinase
MKITANRARNFSWTWIALSWAAFGVFYAVQDVISMRDAGMHHSWLKLFAVLTVGWLPWALATPVVIELARRFPIGRKSWRTWLIHLSAIVVIDAAASAWGAALELWMQPWLPDFEAHGFMTTWPSKTTGDLLPAIILYGMVVAITYALDTKAKAAAQQTDTARLNEQLSYAKLSALQRQIEPHFIFNTLNSVAGLVREQKNEAAVNMIVALSDFLRRVASSASEPTATLAQEAEFLEKYVRIQEARFGARLQFELGIPAELREAKIPTLMLQPLVENAIKHGIAKRAQGGMVLVTAARAGESLRLNVYNDGPLLDQAGSGSVGGIGLSNLRTRLELLYGKQFELLIHNHGLTGVEVTVALPYAEG